jgi:hypothetical protein
LYEKFFKAPRRESCRAWRFRWEVADQGLSFAWLAPPG